MTCTFHKDLASSKEAIRLARDEFLRAIDPLTRADLDNARKGGWTVRKVLDHVIHSEQLYAQALAYVVGGQVSAGPGSSSPDSPADARRMLLDTRRALLKALEALDEDPMAYATFYELKQVGHDEYSAISVLENVANHDREHAEQVQAILADTRD